MVDQEIDALLVGALYGELGPADEARLAAHLESHPTDRSALDDLKSMRQAWLDGRIFELQLDPPPSVSAHLVQEAARRAPKTTGESWFMRMARAFAMRPALAAAATLVVVVGVAGSLYLKKGSDLAAPEPASSNAAASDERVAAPQAPTPAPTALHAEGQDGISVQLDDNKKLEAEDKTAKADVANREQKPSTTVVPAKPRAIAATPRNEQGIVVSGRDQQPKDFETEKSPAPDTATKETSSNALAQHSSSPPPPPAQPVEAGGKGGDLDESKSVAGPATTTATIAKAPTTQGAAGESSRAAHDSSWARDQHARVQSLVHDGRCRDAAPLVVAIKSQAPDYYSAYVASDRSLKQCGPYIANAVERDVERSKAAAAKASKATDSVK